MKAKREAATRPVEGLWALPDGWRWERLGNIACRISDKHHPDQTSELPFVGMDSIAPHTMQVASTAPFGSMRSAASAFRSGDVLYGRLRPYLNKVWQATFDGACSGELIVIRPTDDLDPRYLALFLHSRAFLDFASHAVAGDRPRIDFATIAAFPLPIPDIEQQRRIVARIDEMFAEIDNGEAALVRARDDLATWRKALLKAAVTGELTADWRVANPPTETGADFLTRILANRRAGQTARRSTRQDTHISSEDLPEIPSTWAWTIVGDIGEVSGGITKNAKRDVHALRLPYLRVGNVYAGRVDLSRVETIGVMESEVVRASVQAGDLLIVEGNGSIDQIGRSAIWNGEIDPCLHQNHLIKVRVGERMAANWLQTWLQSPWGRKELEAQASSTSGLHTLSISKVAGLRCPLPPFAELNSILSIVKRLTGEADAGGKDIASVKSDAATLRQSILAAAFRGDLA